MSIVNRNKPISQLISDLVSKGRALVMPGAFDALSARLIQEAGFEAAFVTGYGTAASLLGQPDFGLTTMTEVAWTVARITASVEIPVIADADTGYGNPLNVRRTVREMERSGAAGMLLEDQVWPKRCGHMTGKQVIPMEEYLEKLRAAVEARHTSEFVFIARTDARAPLGLREAIRRAKAYKEAGADIIFVEAPQSADELREIAAEVPGPLMANMVEKGLTPLLPAEELLALGYQVIAYPLSALYAATEAMRETLAELRRSGSTSGCLDRLASFEEFNRLVGLPELMELEKRYGVKS